MQSLEVEWLIPETPCSRTLSCRSFYFLTSTLPVEASAGEVYGSVKEGEISGAAVKKYHDFSENGGSNGAIQKAVEQLLEGCKLMRNWPVFISIMFVSGNIGLVI